MTDASRQRKLPFPYFKFFIDNWLDGTRGLTYEERGAYIDFIVLTMKNEGALNDDDGWFSHQMHVSKRLWKSVKNKLAAKGKLILSDGKIINERCLTELQGLLDQRKNIAAAATSREASKRTRSPVIDILNAEPAANQPRTSREPAANQNRFNSEFSEKPNEINTAPTTTVPQANHYLRLETKDKEESTYRLPLGADAGEVEINCVSINIPTGHAMLYEKIDAEGAKVGLAPEVVRVLAANLAKGMVLRPAPAQAVQPEQAASTQAEQQPLFPLEPSGTKKKVRNKSDYSPNFEKFWAVYRKHANDMEGAKGQAAVEFDALSEKDQDIAITAVPLHAAKLRKTDTKFKHACRFLKHREFDGYAQVASPEAAATSDRELQIRTLALDFEAKEWNHAAKIWKSREDVPKDIVRAARERSEQMVAERNQPGW